MSDLSSIIDAARRWRGQPMALATVTQTWGSAPRPRGSHMLVHADGRLEGSVSGGCVEGEVLAEAARIIAEGGFRRLRYGVADASAWEVGLPCGGEIEVMVQPVSAEGFDPALFEEIAAGRDAGEALSLATDLATGRTTARPQGNGESFVNVYLPPRRMLIVGAVQIAQSLARIAGEIDMAVTVIDPRGRFLTEERFTGTKLDDRWPDEAVAAARPDPATAVVTLSHDPKIDDAALAAALRSPAGYIAALGSRRSHAKRMERLTAEGFSAEDLARIDGPAGIAIGALGPAEIALSVAAGAVQALSRR
ncbi:XdhC family protein [Sphingomonas sp. ID0503]|uniref:XdhC family protein n=1 Tax=Sphingomonas sp. ID0503 TaxID=3399691 RepID=UPI003AFB4332